MKRINVPVGSDLSRTPEGASIAVVVKGAGPGGVERIALRLVDGWRALGLDVALIAADNMDGTDPGSASNHRARDWPIFGARWPVVRLTLSLWRRTRRDPPAILFCPGNSYTVVVVALKLLLGRSCPPIIAKISNDLRRQDMARALYPFYRAWLRVQGHLIDHVAVLSPAMRDEVILLMGVAPDRIHIVPNPVLSAVDLIPIHRPRSSSGGARRFVAVGRLERQKDYPLMLRAFAAGARSIDRLTIFGDGRERDALIRLAATLGLSGRVHFAGHCTDIRGRLADHDILLLTSRYEGHPGAIVEALSVGLDIVATNCCAGMSDLLDDGALGTLVKPGDAAGFAQAVASVVRGRQDHDRALRKASASTIEAALPAYIQIFSTVAGKTLLSSADPFFPPSIAEAA